MVYGEGDRTWLAEGEVEEEEGEKAWRWWSSCCCEAGGSRWKEGTKVVEARSSGLVACKAVLRDRKLVQEAHILVLPSRMAAAEDRSPPYGLVSLRLCDEEGDAVDMVKDEAKILLSPLPCIDSYDYSYVSRHFTEIVGECLC